MIVAHQSARRLSVLAVALCIACGGGEEEAPEEEGAVPVEVATVTRAPFDETIDVLGTVVAPPDAAAALAAPGPTRVTRINVSLGDRVTRGQVLLELDRTVWQAERTRAQAALTAAREARDRTARLVQGGILPRKELDAAEAEVAHATADVTAATQVEGLGELRSPLNGVVSQVNATMGETVDAGSVLVEVIDPTALEVVLSLSPEAASRVKPGAAVRLFRDGPNGLLSLGDGRVVSVAPSLDSTGARPARVNVGASAALFRGASLSARVTVATHPDAITIPAGALVPEGDGEFLVYTVDAENVAHGRPVVVGARSGELVMILSGLEAGERVVVGGAFQVADSVKVTIG